MNATRLRLSIAIRDYDHVRDALSGAVDTGGIELRRVDLPIEDVFRRFLRHGEWEICEMSMGAYAALVARGEAPMVAIPAFPSRMFRHSAIFVRTDSHLRSGGELAGRRIGVVDWAQTAAIYARGALGDQFGVRLEQVAWYQGGLRRPDGRDMVAAEPPPGIALTRVARTSLEAMLLAGELDAVIASRPPGEAGRVRALFGDDARGVEEAYWRERRVFPIMHTVVIRRDVHERHPWVARSLYGALDAARRRSLDRLLDPAAPYFPLPWANEAAVRCLDLFDGDLWPYGVEANRWTLETFCRYAFEQGVCARPVTPDELFPSL